MGVRAAGLALRASITVQHVASVRGLLGSLVAVTRAAAATTISGVVGELQARNVTLGGFLCRVAVGLAGVY